MNDHVFGSLRLNRVDRWEGAADFDFLVDYSAAFDETAAPQPAPLHAPPPANCNSARFTGRLAVEINAETRDSQPTSAQQNAWLTFLARGNTLWNEIVDAAMAVYLRQRPMRMRIWQSVYGNFALDRQLPEVISRQDMIRLICPIRIHVLEEREGEDNADIVVHFAVTWHADGFTALVRNGAVIALGNYDLLHALARNEVIHNPVFGTISRTTPNNAKQSLDPWIGLTRCDPFLDYCLVAGQRAKFVHNAPSASLPRLSVAWEFASQEFEIYVYTPRGEQPSAAQAEAFASFKSAEAAHATEMIHTIFSMYQQTCETVRRKWKDRHVEDLVPCIDEVSGLHDLLQLRGIHIHPADANGRVAIGFQFVCSWDHDGISALWRDGKIVEWGMWNDAKPIG